MRLKTTNHAIALAPALLKDRPLSEEEIEAQDKAQIFPKGKFAPIAPIPGTIAFYVRNVRGGNPSIIGFIKHGLDEVNSNTNTKLVKRIRMMISVWESFDEFSKRRIDFFDWFSRKYSIPKGKLLGLITEGMCNLSESETMIDLVQAKPELIHNIRNFGMKERNFRDRELLAKATGVIKENPLVNVDASSTTNVTNNKLILETGSSNFRDIIRSSENLIRGEQKFIDIVPEARQLSEGETEFVDTEFGVMKKEEFQMVGDKL